MARSLLTFLLTASLAAALGIGCLNTQPLDSADAGRTRTYVPGQPHFDMEALAQWNEAQTGIDLYLGIPPISLVFVQEDEGYTAAYEASVNVHEEEGDALITRASLADTVRVADYEATQAFAPIYQHRAFTVKSGTYLVEVRLTDAESGKEVMRQQRVEVARKAPALSRIHLEARRDTGGFEPLLALHTPGGMDALRAVVQLGHADQADTLTLTMTLTRFRTDTTVALPPFLFTPTRGSLPHRGIQREEADTLQRTRRRLRRSEPNIVVEFALPPLEAGVYRVEVEAQMAGRRLVQRRMMSVKAPSFPRVETLDQMVQALRYIALDDEFERIQRADTPTEKRRRFDAFWGTLLDNRQLAADVMERYYSRVEKANLRFTAYKEGWKTDRGMVYIVLGAPAYVEQELNAEIWHYSYRGRNLRNAFVFKRVRGYADEDAIEQYVLQRHPAYDWTWQRALERWRQGNVL